MTICVIPARGESKRIPRKNIKDFNGKPMIQWSIEAADASNIFNNIFVSTDDDEIAEIAKSLGAEVPFIRPKKLAKDNSSTFSVLKHAVKWLEKNENWRADIIVLLQPTTPFRKGTHIDAVVKLLLKSRSDAATTIKKVTYPSHWLLKIVNKNIILNLFKGGNRYLRRQDAPQTYQPAGLVSAMTRKLLFSLKTTLPAGDTRGYIIPSKFGINIDSSHDYKLAVSLLGKKILK